MTEVDCKVMLITEAHILQLLLLLLCSAWLKKLLDIEMRSLHAPSDIVYVTVWVSTPTPCLCDYVEADKVKLCDCEG